MEVPEIPKSESLPVETLLADGWQYRDLPRMTPKLMGEFTEIVGSDNMRWLTRAGYGDGTVRGQLLISPAGLARMKVYSAGAKAAKAVMDAQDGVAKG